MPVKGPNANIPDEGVHETILRMCLQRGNTVALIDNCRDGATITYEEIYNQSRCCAAFLHKNGIRKGDFVGLCSPSGREYAVAFLGILSCGAVVNPCNPMFTEGEISKLFSNVRPKAVFVHEGALETMKKIQKDLPFIQNIFLIGPSSMNVEDCVSWNDIVTYKEGNKDTGRDFVDNMKINPEKDLALLPYSSGTTGLPKAVMLTHSNLACAKMALTSCFTPCDDMIVCTDRSMYHMFGILTLLSCLSNGNRLIVGKEYSLGSMTEAIEKYKVTHITTVPPLLIRMANGEMMDKHQTKSLKQALCGGDTVSANVIDTLTRNYNIDISHLYGITEAGVPSVNTNTREDSASVGYPTLGTEIKIIDFVSSEDLGKEKKGEVLIRGHQVTKGYLNDPQANGLLAEGWMRTGDIGLFDKNGALCVVGRMKDIIMYRARQISPSEVESVVSKHPKVADVGVVGIPHPVNGEVTKAFIVKKDPSLTEKEVHDFVNRELVDYKQLVGGVQFLDAIPKSPTGKILRRKLREL